MLEYLAVLHLQPGLGGTQSEEILRGQNLLSFRTCLREIIIGYDTQQILDLAERIQGPAKSIKVGCDAYQFLLEVICGLHSPVVGETEVLGQFKGLLEKASFDKSTGDQMLKRIFQGLLTDTKLVREQYLKGMGTQSYGGLVRKNLKPGQPVNIIGAGLLVKDMLPWLTKSTSTLSLFNRTPQKAAELIDELSKRESIGFGLTIRVEPLNPEALIPGVLVVAAPLTSAELRRWITPEISQIIDLRDTCDSDPIDTCGKPLQTLTQYFTQLHLHKERTKIQVEQALTAIRECALKRASFVEVRPQGWEDLCG
jgi:glutamyl-tRNA reductase